MKKMTATHELTTGEQQQVAKQEGRSRYNNRRRDKQRTNGEQRIKPIVKREEQTIDDEDLIGIDLRRVTKLADLEI